MKRLNAFLRRLRDVRKYKGSMVYGARKSVISYMLAYLRWSLRCRFGPTILAEGSERATAVILTYKRLHNLEPIVRALLRCEWIERIIVINNNASARAADWIAIRHPAMILIDNSENKGTIERYVVASKEPGDYFLSIDDDIFLSPEQLTTLFRHLIDNPSVPHGMFGQMWRGAHATHPADSFTNCIIEFDGEIDIVNRVYFFTKTHAKRCVELAREMCEPWQESPLYLTKSDDIFLSWSGKGKPLCHAVGRFVDCPTQAQPGIALWTEQGIIPERRDLFATLQERSERTDLQRE